MNQTWEWSQVNRFYMESHIVPEIFVYEFYIRMLLIIVYWL